MSFVILVKVVADLIESQCNINMLCLLLIGWEEKGSQISPTHTIKVFGFCYNMQIYKAYPSSAYSNCG